MKPPSNISQTIKAISLCKRSLVDKAILHCLVGWATAGQGTEHAYPGMVSLCDSANRSDKTVRRHLAALESDRIIECTAHRKGGRGHAPEYRICIENPIFKEFMPKPKADTKDVPLSDDEGGQSERQRRTKRSVKADTSEIKADTLPVKADTKDVPPSLSHPQDHPKTTPTPIRPSETNEPKTVMAVEEVSATKGLASLDPLPEEMQGATFGKRKSEVEALIQKHGPHVIKRALRRWIDCRDMPVDGLTKKPRWYAFLDECEPIIKAVIEGAKKQIEESAAHRATLEAAEIGIAKIIEAEKESRAKRMARGRSEGNPQNGDGADPSEYIDIPIGIHIEAHLAEQDAKAAYRASPEGKAAELAATYALAGQIEMKRRKEEQERDANRNEMSLEDFLNTE
jgi:hypothetical protein